MESENLGPGGTTELSRWRGGLAAAATGMVAVVVWPPRRVRGKTKGSYQEAKGSHRFTAVSLRRSFSALVQRPWPGRMVSRWDESGGRTRLRGLAAGSSPAAFQAESGKPSGKWLKLRVPSGWEHRWLPIPKGLRPKARGCEELPRG